MAKLKMTEESLFELLKKFKADSDSLAEDSDYYRGKADALDVVLFAFEE